MDNLTVNEYTFCQQLGTPGPTLLDKWSLYQMIYDKEKLNFLPSWSFLI